MNSFSPNSLHSAAGSAMANQQHSHLADKTTQGIPDSTGPESTQQHQVFFFFPKRWKQGIANILIACCLAAGGTVLLTQLGEPPNLIVQMTILGLGLWGGAIYLFSQAASDLGGYLRLDSEGVHFRQKFATKAIPWKNVKSWNLSGDDQPFEINRLLMVNSTGEEPALVVHCENFRPESLPILQKTLLFYAPCK